MFETLSAVFWGVLTFSILVVLHEGGHFLTARAFGVHVHEFMIGLPGPAIRFRGKKTDYGITAIPLGGYVRISGMEPGPEEPLLGPALAYVTRVRTATADDVGAFARHRRREGRRSAGHPDRLERHRGCTRGRPGTSPRSLPRRPTTPTRCSTSRGPRPTAVFRRSSGSWCSRLASSSTCSQRSWCSCWC